MERGLLRKVPLSKYQILEESTLSNAIQKKRLFIRIAFVTKRLEFALNNKREMRLNDWFRSHSWWWTDWRSHVSVLCNLIQIYWSEGTTASSTDVNLLYLLGWINRTPWNIISSTCRRYTSTFPRMILWNFPVLKMKGQKPVKNEKLMKKIWYFLLQLKFCMKGITLIMVQYYVTCMAGASKCLFLFFFFNEMKPFNETFSLLQVCYALFSLRKDKSLCVTASECYRPGEKVRDNPSPSKVLLNLTKLKYSSLIFLHLKDQCHF